MAFPKTYWYLKASAWSAVAPWAASTSYNAGTFVRQLATPTVGNERVNVCIVTGVSGSTEPTWVITRGAKTTDNTVTWMECTGVAGPNGDATNTVNWNSVKNTAVSLGSVIKDIAATTYFICVTAGTAGNGSEPSWNTATGANTTDNTVTWMSLGAISGYSTPFQYPFARLQTPLATGFMLAGETGYASNNHSETQATAMAFPSTNATAAKQITWYTVNDSAAPPTALATGSSLNTTGVSGMNVGASACYFYGFSVNSGSGTSTASITCGGISSTQTFKNCSFSLNNSSASSFYLFESATGVTMLPTFDGCSFTFGNTAQTFGAGGNGFGANMVNCTYAASGSVPTTLFNFGGRIGALYVRDSNASTVTGTLVGGSITDGSPIIQNCKIGSGVTLSNMTFQTTENYLKIHNCDSTGTNYRYGYYGYTGSVVSETTIVRTGGATNGVTQLSWKVVSTLTPSYNFPFVTEDIAQWDNSSGSAQTATLYLTTNSSLTNADCWLEIEYLGTSGFPQGVLASSQLAVFGTPTALSSDTSTWGGSTTNKYKIQVTFTTQLVGPIKARFYVATPSLTIYIDPLIQVA